MANTCKDCKDGIKEGSGTCGNYSRYLLNLKTGAKNDITLDKEACEFFNIVDTSNSKSGSHKDKTETPTNIIDEANRILEHGDPIKYIFDVHQSLHMGDELLTYLRIAAVGNQSASNTKGIQPSADGASGKGKSDGDKKFVHLLPPEYVLSGSVSDKVLYYKKDLKPGTYIHSDDVDLSDDLTSTLKRATSNFQQYTPHHTLDKDRNVIDHSLPPRLVWALNSVNNVESQQLVNRQFGCSVDESPEQDEKVLAYQKYCGMFGSEELPTTDEVLICREIIREIKKHLFKVVIPFSYLIEWKDASNRRNFDMFLDMIKGFTVYRFKQRETNNEIIFANLQDFDDAVKLYGKRTENQGRKLTDAELKLIKAIHSNGRSDIKTLQSIIGVSRGRILQLINGKGKDSDSGLIHKIPGMIIEDVTEPTISGTSTKKYYSLTNFDENQYKNRIVWIDDIARKEFEGCYKDVTRVLLLKIKNSKEVVTHVTHNMNIHSNKKYNNLLESLLLYNSQKWVTTLTTSQPIMNDEGNNLLTSEVTSEVVTPDSKSNPKSDNTLTELHKNMLSFESSWGLGQVNSSNLVEFSIRFIDAFNPKYPTTGDYYTPSAIRGIAAKIFKITPGVN